MAPRSASRIRLDELLVQRGHTPTREKARALVLAGRVTAPGLPFLKPGQRVPDDLQLDVTVGQTFVSRGGLKLDHALTHFRVDPAGAVCADFGASTGGFTDCLLQRGANRVYAVDVSYGQLDWRLRGDTRVVVLERTNARFLDRLDEPVSLTVMDVSFISLRMLLPTILRISAPGAELVTLVKPQFEAGKGRVGKGGIVRDPAVHREVLTGLASWLEAAGQELVGVTASPIRGAGGNAEFLAHVRLDITRDGLPTVPLEYTALAPSTQTEIDTALVDALAVPTGKH